MRRTPIVLMKFTAKAILNAAAFGLPAGDFVIDVLPEVAGDLWDKWGKPRDEAEIRADVEALVAVSDDEAPALAAEMVAEVAADEPEPVRQGLTSYLAQMPAAARKSLQRPGDPSGQTVPPTRTPRGSDDLLQMLPNGLPRFQPGYKLPGLDWKLETFLGKGGFGEVWKARHLYRESQPPVALKFCHDPRAARLLHNEIKLLDRVESQGTHPGIVRLLGTHLNADPPCLVYELIEGGDLAGLVRDWYRGGFAPSSLRIAKVMRRLAKIVGFAHRLDPPIVHRDLKPSNVLVASLGDRLVLKVADFGIGGLAAAQAIRQQTRLGVSQAQFLVSAARGAFTPHYAPWQQMNGLPPDPRDDVFALGVIWYQLIVNNLSVGRPGGEGWKRRMVERGLSNEMIALLVSCFEDDRDDRPADAATLADQIADLLKPLAPAAQKPREVPPALGWHDHVDAQDYEGYGDSWYAQGQFDQAIRHYGHAISCCPETARYYRKRGDAWHAKKEYDRAIVDYDEAIRLDPEDASAHNSRAWLWAACPDERYRDGKRAVELATRACELSGWKYAETHNTLAAALAEAGDFEAAAAWQTKAVGLSTDEKQKERYRSRLALYKNNKPYRR